MKPDFSSLTYKKTSINNTKDVEESKWITAEKIAVKNTYSIKDIEGLKHLNFAAGIAPNLRGPYSTMYVMRPWTIRQYAGFSTAEESNAFLPKKFSCWSKRIVGSL